MSQQSVERTIGKLCTDEEFRTRFFASPEAAAHEAGLLLSPCELEALTALDEKAVARFGRRIDPRITRLSLEKDVDGHCTK